MTDMNSTTKSSRHLNPFSTDKQLKDRKPAAKRYEISDHGCPGLRVRVEPTGHKTFVWYVRCQGKQRIVVIGTYPDLSLAGARRSLDDLKQKHADGKLFNNQHTIPKTVSDLCEEFYSQYIEKKRKRPDAVRQVYDHDIIPVIGHRKLNSITASDVNHLVKKVVNRGATVHAGKVLALVKQLFGYAVSMSYIEISPAASQKPAFLGVENNIGDRCLDAQEIHEFWHALYKAPRMSDPVRVAFRILLLSGVRSGELRLARWEHIDFEKRTWYVPEENSKTDAWIIPLSSHLFKQFRVLHNISGEFEWVVPGKNGPVTDKVFSRAMRRLFKIEVDGKKILNIPPATPHDLRRTMRTGLSKLKIKPYIAERCLNHSLGKILQIYDKNILLDERRDALEKWGDYVNLVVNDHHNVIVLEQQA